MYFTKTVAVLLSLLFCACVSAAPVAIPMPVVDAVSHMYPRDVKLIQAYHKRQDSTDVVTITDSEPVMAPDGNVVPYVNKRQESSDIVQITDSEPVMAPDGNVVPYAERPSPEEA